MCSLEEEMSDIKVRCSDVSFEPMGDYVECFSLSYDGCENGWRMREQAVAELFYSTGVWD